MSSLHSEGNRFPNSTDKKLYELFANKTLSAEQSDDIVSTIFHEPQLHDFFRVAKEK
jgi:hypothetical protein